MVQTVLGKIGQERGLLWCPGEEGGQNWTLEDWEALRLGKPNSRKRNSHVRRHAGWIEFIQLFTDSHCVLCSAEGDRFSQDLAL